MEQNQNREFALCWSAESTRSRRHWVWKFLVYRWTHLIEKQKLLSKMLSLQSQTDFLRLCYEIELYVWQKICIVSVYILYYRNFDHECLMVKYCWSAQENKWYLVTIWQISGIISFYFPTTDDNSWEYRRHYSVHKTPFPAPTEKLFK